MSALDPSARVDSLSPFAATGPLDTASRLPLLMLRLGLALALVAFLSFCIMWIRWQTVPEFPGVSADFISFWTAGQLALGGHAVDAYRETPHYLKQLALHRDLNRGYLAFFYPPFFLLPCAALALLGYLPAVGLWIASTCVGYAAAIRWMLSKCVHQGEHVWVLFLGYPAVMVNAGFGQNGFLSASLFGGAAVWLERRPELAGLCLGCLAYKPQLGIIVPLGLAVAGRWRCFAAACATVLALTVVTTLAFGVDVWPAFFCRYGGRQAEMDGGAGPRLSQVLNHGFRCAAPARRLVAARLYGAGVGRRRGHANAGARAAATAARRTIG
jgi:hypothetical protein